MIPTMMKTLAGVMSSSPSTLLSLLKSSFSLPVLATSLGSEKQIKGNNFFSSNTFPFRNCKTKIEKKQQTLANFMQRGSLRLGLGALVHLLENKEKF